MNKQTERRLSLLFRAGAALLLLFVVGCWFWFNLGRQYVQDWDAAKVYYHAAQMWNSKTIAIPGWIYETTGEWDCSSLPSILLYGLTGNILLSFGISNCLNILLFCLTGFLIFRKMRVSTPVSCLILTFLLLPWSWGMLEYSNMLFYGAAQYIYKITVPLLLIALYEDGEKALSRVPRILLTIVLLILTLATSSSSGIYVLACGIAPVLLCRIISALSKDLKGIRRFNLLLDAAVLIAAFAGVFLHKNLQMRTPADGMTLVTLNQLWANISASFMDILRILDIFPTKTASAFTLRSFGHLMRIALFGLVLLMGLSRFRSSFCFAEAFGKEKTENSAAEAELVTIFFWNFLVCSLAQSTGRYQLIGWIPLVLAAGVTLEELLNRRASASLRLACGYALCALSFLLAGYLWVQALHSIREDHSDISRWIAVTADEQNADTVIFLNESSTMEETQPLDLGRKYGNYDSKMGRLHLWDDYGTREERSSYDDHHLLIVTENSRFSSLPDYLKCQYTFEEDLGNGYLVYVSDHNRLDGLTGPGDGSGTTIDFPHSYAYRSSDTYDAEGLLALADGFLESPTFTAGPDGTHVTLTVKNISGAPVLKITENGTERTAALDENSAFDVAPSAEFSFSITAGPEDTVTVDRIEYTNP